MFSFSDTYTRLDRFHALTLKFFNGDFLSNRQKLLYNFFDATVLCAKGATSVISEHRELYTNTFFPAYSGQPQASKAIQLYQGDNPSVLELRIKLQSSLSGYLAGAYLHGSLATTEEIDYSDLDVLLIFEESAFQDAHELGFVCSRVLEARGILFEYDPLQHHGFFVLSKHDLQHYPENYFPSILFDHAKSLLDNKGLSVTVFHRASLKQQDNYLQFLKMVKAIQQKLKARAYPRNYYELKLLLSQFMLMPSLYCQAKGTPVFKKDSFGLARLDFSSDEWKIMDDISRMRESWQFWPSIPFRLLRRLFPSPFFSTIYQKKIGQPLPSFLRAQLTPEFYSHASRLLALMTEKVEEERRLSPV